MVKLDLAGAKTQRQRQHELPSATRKYISEVEDKGKPTVEIICQ